MSDKCSACGVEFTKHVGVQGTCKKLQIALDALEVYAHREKRSPKMGKTATRAMNKIKRPSEE